MANKSISQFTSRYRTTLDTNDMFLLANANNKTNYNIQYAELQSRLNTDIMQGVDITAINTLAMDNKDKIDTLNRTTEIIQLTQETDRNTVVDLSSLLSNVVTFANKPYSKAKINGGYIYDIALSTQQISTYVEQLPTKDLYESLSYTVDGYDSRIKTCTERLDMIETPPTGSEKETGCLKIGFTTTNNRYGVLTDINGRAYVEVRNVTPVYEDPRTDILASISSFYSYENEDGLIDKVGLATNRLDLIANFKTIEMPIEDDEGTLTVYQLSSGIVYDISNYLSTAIQLDENNVLSGGAVKDYADDISNYLSTAIQLDENNVLSGGAVKDYVDCKIRYLKQTKDVSDIEIDTLNAVTKTYKIDINENGVKKLKDFNIDYVEMRIHNSDTYINYETVNIIYNTMILKYDDEYQHYIVLNLRNMASNKITIDVKVHYTYNIDDEIEEYE